MRERERERERETERVYTWQDDMEMVYTPRRIVHWDSQSFTLTTYNNSSSTRYDSLVRVVGLHQSQMFQPIGTLYYNVLLAFYKMRLHLRHATKNKYSTRMMMIHK